MPPLPVLIGSGIAAGQPGGDRAAARPARRRPRRYALGALLAVGAVACWIPDPKRQIWLRAHPDRSPRGWATAQGLANAAAGAGRCACSPGRGSGSGSGVVPMPFVPRSGVPSSRLMFAIGPFALARHAVNEARPALPPIAGRPADRVRDARRWPTPSCARPLARPRPRWPTSCCWWPACCGRCARSTSQEATEATIQTGGVPGRVMIHKRSNAVTLSRTGMPTETEETFRCEVRFRRADRRPARGSRRRRVWPAWWCARHCRHRGPRWWSRPPPRSSRPSAFGTERSRRRPEAPDHRARARRLRADSAAPALAGSRCGGGRSARAALSAARA